ncbi:hypothetical protein RND71_012428 [Anisodus tanguticus]|uniref:BHLH domain-containing protein n=1 Tax=Anisodus tanguticus TaxID=243964 RepID=A0AAE1VLS4_9SOLA|nr:hypothetical protein RND71_012428 [Anisodus tanguticus]
MSLGGIYNGENYVAQRLFEEYKHSWLIMDNRPSSSSSFSLDSPGEYSSLLFNVASTPYVPEPSRTDAYSEHTIRPVSATAMPYQQQAIQTTHTQTQIRGFQFPRVETEDAALTRAYLAVMTSPYSSSSSHQSRENVPTDHYQIATQKATAFRRFRPGLGSNNVQIAARTRRENMLRRSITFFRNLNMLRRKEQIQATPRAPTSTEVHHMISERRRREKLNDSFQLLRSLLPPGTKKDKASVLANTTEYLSSLKAQVEELSKKNEMLEAEVNKPQMKSDAISSSTSNGNERVGVEIINVGESTSESRIVDLQVSIRGECSILDFVTRLLEFLKTDNNVTLESVAANTRPMVQSAPVTNITLRIRIEIRVPSPLETKMNQNHAK